MDPTNIPRNTNHNDATAQSATSQWLSPPRNSGSPDSGTAALTERNMHQRRKAPPRLKNPAPSTPRMSTNCGTRGNQPAHIRLTARRSRHTDTPHPPVGNDEAGARIHQEPASPRPLDNRDYNSEEAATRVRSSVVHATDSARSTSHRWPMVSLQIRMPSPRLGRSAERSVPAVGYSDSDANVRRGRPRSTRY